MQGKSVAKIVISILIAVVASVILFVTGNIHYNLSKLVDYLNESCTETATGEVYTHAKQGVELLYRENLVGAEFTLDGKSYHAGGIDDGSHNPGDTLTVHYNPDRPVECYAGVGPSLVNHKLTYLIYGVCSLVILGAIITLIYTVINSKKQ